MRILAVTQILCFREVQRSHLREHDCRVDLLREPSSNSAIVLRSGIEHIERELKARFIGGRAIVSAHLLEHCIIERRIGNHCDRSEILRRAAQHRRTSDIDVLDTLSEMDKYKAYIRVADENILANEILVLSWEKKRRKDGTLVKISKPVERLFSYLEQYPYINAGQLCRIGHVNYYTAKNILSDLLAIDALEYVVVDKRIFYQRVPGNDKLAL